MENLKEFDNKDEIYLDLDLERFKIDINTLLVVTIDIQKSP